MEKVKYSYFRYRILMFTTAILANAFNAFVSKKIYWPAIPTLALLSYFMPNIMLQNKNSKELSGTYFSKDGLSEYHTNELLFQIKWKDLYIEKITIFKIKKYGCFKISSKENSELTLLIPISWFLEESLLTLVRKYTPEENEFYKAIENYAFERKISF